MFPQGLYEKIDLGDDGLVYDALTSLGFIHVDGVGPPTSPPTRPVQGYGNDLGQLWISGGTFAYHTIDPGGTDSAFTHDLYVSDPATRTQIFDEVGDGGFSWLIGGGVTGFVQWQGAGNYVENLLWREVWNYIAEHVHSGTGAAHQLAVRYRDHALFAGGFASLTPALRVVDIFLGGDPFTVDTFFWGDRTIGPHDGLRVVDTLVPGDVVRSDNFFWNGPMQTNRDVQDYVEDHLYGMVKDILVAGANVTIDDDDDDETLTLAAAVAPGTGDGVVNAVTLDVTGQELTVTLGRTIAGVVEGTVTLPAATPGPGAFVWPAPTKLAAVTIGVNTAVAVGYQIGAVTDNTLMLQIMGNNGDTGYTVLPIIWLPVSEAGDALNTSTASISVPIRHNRKMYLARDAANMLVGAVNNSDVGTSYDFWITEIPSA